MDTSEEYIKMCLKAIEIQRLWVVKAWDYIYGLHAEPGVKKSKVHVISGYCTDGGHYGLSTEYCEEYFKSNFTWLIRQDQLLEMLEEERYQVLYGLTSFEGDLRYMNIFKGTTMEQLILTYVMYHKYDKTWNGQEWIKLNK